MPWSARYLPRRPSGDTATTALRPDRTLKWQGTGHKCYIYDDVQHSCSTKLHSDAGLLEENPGKQETKMYIQQKQITTIRFQPTLQLGDARKRECENIAQKSTGGSRRHPSSICSVSRRWSREQTEYQRRQEHHQNNDSFGGRYPLSS
jgi:hypothetical protein